MDRIWVLLQVDYDEDDVMRMFDRYLRSWVQWVTALTIWANFRTTINACQTLNSRSNIDGSALKSSRIVP